MSTRPSRPSGRPHRSRLGDALASAKTEGRAALIVYLTAGDPELGATPDLIVAAAEAGADVIEVGVPFSDPTADGVAIQKASERALRAGTTLKGVLDAVRLARMRTAVPIVLFGYYNPILAYGETRFAADAADAGVDGLLVVDLPPEEAAPLWDPARDQGLDWIPLVAPTSTEARLRAAREVATSMVYYVSLTGVTGAAAPDLAAAAQRALEVRKVIGLPVAVGFGIKSRADVAAVAGTGIDAVVVGSVIVSTIDRSGPAAVGAVRDLIKELRSGLRG